MLIGVRAPLITTAAPPQGLSGQTKHTYILTASRLVRENPHFVEIAARLQAIVRATPPPTAPFPQHAFKTSWTSQNEYPMRSFATILISEVR